MGMYNEVFKACPHCGSSVMVQIPQVVLGFGNFVLDRPDLIKQELTYAQRQELAEYVNRERFYCQDCNNSFTVNVEVDIESERQTSVKI